MSESYREILEDVATNVVALNADRTDREARFPVESMNALKERGLLRLLSSPDLGGGGEGPRAAMAVVERLARECGSTAMITCMHYAATTVIEAFGSQAQKKAIVDGALGTLAFSESGSRSHFWAPVSTAKRDGDDIRLTAKKSWVTSASHADFYVWSSRPVEAEGASTIWYLPRDTRGVAPAGAFDGLGLRGNDSTPVAAESAVVPASYRLGDDGAGLKVMLETVLPVFNVMTAGVAVGLMEGATQAACAHAAGTRYEHLESALAELPTIRAYLARMRIDTDRTRTLVEDTVTAMETGRADVMLRVLESKAAAGESATGVLDLAMRVCGGAAFRKDVGVERRFRDARAGTVMAPTTDQLYDFIGKAICGMEVF